MALNPLRDAVRRAHDDATTTATPFQADAEAALAGFRALRQDLQRQVRFGDLTPKVARQRAAEAASDLRRDLLAQGERFQPMPPVFLERLTMAADARKSTRGGPSLDALQRETNRLLRLSLVEQQLTNRAAEFEGRTYVRPIHGGQPAPTLASLLEFHAHAEQAGDDAAREWARRQLEGMRNRLVDPEDHARIDTACDRPDRVNPRLVARYVEVLQEADPSDLEAFVGQALGDRDASACCAAFVLAREAPDGLSTRWVREVLEGLKAFPDSALEHLRAREADLHREATAAAHAQVERVAALAESEARLPDLEPPSPAELERHARIAARPVAAPDEPIGLALARRGRLLEEFGPALGQDTAANDNVTEPGEDVV